MAVPTHFFKVVVGETGSGDLEMEAYVMPNEAIPDSAPLASFQASCLLLRSPLLPFPFQQIFRHCAVETLAGNVVTQSDTTPNGCRETCKGF